MQKPQDRCVPWRANTFDKTAAAAAPAPHSDGVKIGTDATNTVVTISIAPWSCASTTQNFDTKINYASQNGKDKFEKIKIDDLPPNYTISHLDGQNRIFFSGTTTALITAEAITIFPTMPLAWKRTMPR